METVFLGRVPFTRALAAQAEALNRVQDGHPGVLIGFESEPTITLGVRARGSVDLLWQEDKLRARGVAILRVDRGGQATLHNPGQLIIFPVCSIGGGGVRAWVARLAEVTARIAQQFGRPLEWSDAAPGLYDANAAKVVALGVRVRRGVSTHGLAINVRNDLEAFAMIRACGHAEARVAHLGVEVDLNVLFERWAGEFKRA